MSEAAADSASGEAPRATSKPTACDLCGLRLPRQSFTTTVDEHTLHFCCAGCRHVYLLLRESGLVDGDYRESDLYKQCLKLGIIGNPSDANKPTELSPEDLKGARELFLHVDGMWCSACSWLIEKVVGSQPGVVHVQVSFASDTIRAYYRPEQIAPERIAESIEKLGYRAVSRDELQETSAAELNRLLIRTGVALFLLMNIMFFSYTLYIGYFQELASEIRFWVPLILLVLSSPAVFWCGAPIHQKAWRSLRAGAPTMELLLTLSIFAAFLYSVYALLRGMEHFYFDTASALVALLLVGKLIEHSAKHKASERIHNLHQMLPRKVRVKTDAGERMVSVDTLNVGDRFAVRPGEKIPADGCIVAGRTTVDESLLTGESKPRERHIGDAVTGSSMNLSGAIEVETTRVGDDMLLSGIIRMVEGALTRKSPLERIVDRIARVFVPGVITIALLTAIVLLVSGAGVESALLRGVTVLVVACPCALGMATPLAIAAGVGYAAGLGVLIRDGAILERAGRVDTVVFDKTGTLTRGRFELLDVIVAGHSEDEVLRLAASLEQHANHPIADAIVRAANDRGLRLEASEDVQTVDGKGVTGLVGEVRQTCAFIGSASYIQETGFMVPESAVARISEHTAQGHTVVFFGVEGSDAAACLVLGDELRPSAASAVAALRRRFAGVQILSGDSAETTAAIAAEAKVDEFGAELLPQGKTERIEALQAAGRVVAMVGDGVNDAPALAQADVGIALAGGTEFAVESSAMTLLRDDLMLVDEAFDIARRTVRTVRQNLAWAFVYNAAGIVLAIVGVLNPLIAAGAMLLSSLSVAVNSLRLRSARGTLSKNLVEFFLPWIEPSPTA